ncbi:hypothetical protein ACIQU5_01025 [Streptomyces sp. NPDC090306]|uniref:hypothetical protein n=1 Tax=unclassified Streptomyces TaxID=2593676 RepID=UPI0036E7DBF0
MTADPTEPGTYPDEDTTGLDVEAPAADAAEQNTDLAPTGDEEPATDPVEADEADVVEQSRVVAHDEDDYR